LSSREFVKWGRTQYLHCLRWSGPGQSAAFREPGGVCTGVDGLYIADTNNHRIAIADWTTGTVRTLIGG